MRALLAAAVLLTVALGPALLAGSAQEGSAAPDDRARPTSTVTMFAHVYDVGRTGPMPGNTQYPWGEDDFSAGSPAPCIAGNPVAVGIPIIGSFDDCDVHETNVLYLYSTAGFVNADPDAWSYEDFHNERGQAKDVLLDPAQDVTATLYMSADAHAWYPGVLVPRVIAPGVPNPVPNWNWDPGAHPDWQVEATLWLVHLGEYQGQASEPPPVDEMLRTEGGVMVARGLTDPVLMLSLDSNLPGAEGEVYEFAVNLGKPQVDRIPKEMDWVLQFRWWSATAGQRAIVPLSWNLNSGEFYPVRFTMPVKNAFDVELVFPQFLHGKLLVHTMMNSPWGSYDIDPASVRLDIEPVDGGTPVDLRAVQPVADYSVAHGGHYKPINATWVLDPAALGMRPGTYRATVTASNFQHSATSSTEALFRILPDGTGETLVVGRSGQATFSEAQLAGLEEGAGDGEVRAATAGAPAPLPAAGAREVPGPGALPLLLGLAAAAAVLAALGRGRVR